LLPVESGAIFAITNEDGGMRLLSLFAASTLVAVSSTTLLAQPRPSLEILIEDLEPAAARCGIVESTLRTLVTLTLWSNQISASKEKSDPFLHLSLNVIFLENVDSCTFNIKTRVTSVQVPRKRNGLQTARGGEVVVLCEMSGMGAGSRNGISKQVSEAVEQQVRNCLADLEY
jgi:hypothetical protein